MTEKRFRYDWKTGRFKDTQSNSCATTNMRVLETQINNACYNYEKKIKELEEENKEIQKENEQLKKAWKYNCEICEKRKKFRQYEVKTECEDFELDLEKVLK